MCRILENFPSKNSVTISEIDNNGRLYTRWAGAFLDGEYGMDLEGKADRVLISAMAFDEWDSHDDYGLHHKALAWEVISWSKSEGAYHVETWQAPKYLDGSHKSSEQSWKEYDRTFDSFPSEKCRICATCP